MKRPSSPEDTALFREAVADARPLREKPREPLPRRAAPARARFSRAERRAVLEESLQGDAGDPALAPGDELLFRRPGVQDAVLRKLRRGQYRVDGEIDLHGLTVAQAKQALREFVADATALGSHCLRVIHGKGLRSGPRGPVLKGAVDLVLRRTDAVLAFVSARRADGGTGALYVLLSRTTA